MELQDLNVVFGGLRCCDSSRGLGVGGVELETTCWSRTSRYSPGDLRSLHSWWALDEDDKDVEVPQMGWSTDNALQTAVS